jgi:hypothetical protein
VAGPDRVKLLHAPYRLPCVRRGDLATCRFRDCDVVITGWSAARFSWPRCRAVGRRGGSGLLADEELARAVRTESANAIRYWFGVSVDVVWRWRKALGVTNRCANAGLNARPPWGRPSSFKPACPAPTQRGREEPARGAPAGSDDTRDPSRRGEGPRVLLVGLGGVWAGPTAPARVPARG